MSGLFLLKKEDEMYSDEIPLRNQPSCPGEHAAKCSCAPLLAFARWCFCSHDSRTGSSPFQQSQSTGCIPAMVALITQHVTDPAFASSRTFVSRSRRSSPPLHRAAAKEALRPVSGAWRSLWRDDRKLMSCTVTAACHAAI